jgi:hypothetical protein
MVSTLPHSVLHSSFCAGRQLATSRLLIRLNGNGVLCGHAFPLAKHYIQGSLIYMPGVWSAHWRCLLGGQFKPQLNKSNPRITSQLSCQHIACTTLVSTVQLHFLLWLPQTIEKSYMIGMYHHCLCWLWHKFTPDLTDHIYIWRQRRLLLEASMLRLLAYGICIPCMPPYSLSCSISLWGSMCLPIMAHHSKRKKPLHELIVCSKLSLIKERHYAFLEGLVIS